MNDTHDPAGLPERLAEAPADVRARALAKGARVLSRMRPGEPLRGHTRRGDDDEQLRRVVVRLATADDLDALRALASAVGAQEDGVRSLLRAVGNLRRLQSTPTCLMAMVLVRELRTHLDHGQLSKTLARLLRAIDTPEASASAYVTEIVELALELLTHTPSSSPPTSRPAPSPASSPESLPGALEAAEEAESTRTWLLQEFIAHELRGDADSDQLARVRAPLCPKRLPRESAERLLQAAQDKETPWSSRLAAWWLLANVNPKHGKDAIAALDRAFEVFPLESLSAVEQTQIAIEHAVAEHLDDPFATEQHRFPFPDDVSLPKTMDALARIAGWAQRGELSAEPAELQGRLAERPAAEQLIIGAILDPWLGSQVAKRLRKGKSINEAIVTWFSSPETACMEPWQTLSGELLSGAGQTHDRWSELSMKWQDALVSGDEGELRTVAQAVAALAGASKPA